MIKWAGILVFIALVALPLSLRAEKARVVVLTDISNEPDDEQSLVRFLVYANEFDVEGLVATTSTWLRTRTREDLIRRQIEAYGQVRQNLLKHAPGYPTVEDLLKVTSTGQTNYGMSGVGPGKSSPGSARITSAATRDDRRPLWVCIWGGANTLAQALSDARMALPPEQLKSLVSKLRVYTISDQDDSGPWLRREFPELFYIVSPSTTDWKEYWRATWTGISGDRHYKNGPAHLFHLVDNPWLEENVSRNHGPLGALYPRVAYIMEGDTPSFLGLIENGLGWAANPGNGGWGGRYVLYQAYGETRPIWTNNQDSRDTCVAEDGKSYCSDPASIWRWREHYQYDFAARMDWCVATEYKTANHNPKTVLNGDSSREILHLRAKSGEAVNLSAKGSNDPDEDGLSYSWFVYREAGTFAGEATLSQSTGESTSLRIPPAGAKPQQGSTVHVILTVRDNGSPPLFAYRRAIITVEP